MFYGASIFNDGTATLLFNFLQIEDIGTRTSAAFPEPIEIIIEEDNIELNNSKIGIGTNNIQNNISIGTNSDPMNTNLPQRTITIGNSNVNSKLFLPSNVYSLKNFYTQSDRRVKKDITTIENALTKIEKIRPVNYRLKNDPHSKLNMGVIAQELNEIFPDLVNGKELEDGTLSVNYTSLIGLLIAGMKEQNNKIDLLTSKIEELSEIIESNNTY